MKLRSPATPPRKISTRFPVTSPFCLSVFFILFSLPTGAGAALIDITAKGTASQSTEYQGGRFPANLAVDGNLSTFSHTNTTTANNRWELLLDQEYEIAKVEVTMRNDCCGGRMTGSILRFYDEEGDSVFEETLTDPGVGGTTSFTISPEITARKIRLGLENGHKNPNTNLSLVQLGEVRVFTESVSLPEVISFTASPSEISSGETTALSWEIEGSDEVRLFPGGVTYSANESVVVSPGASQIYSLEVVNERGRAAAQLGVVVEGEALAPRVTEFLADNESDLERSDGSTPDWIEVWNPNPLPLDLTGYGLSDNAMMPRLFVFPPTIVPGNSYLLIDASAQARDGVLATGFALDRAAGSTLILTNPSSQILQTVTYPRQVKDVSYGLDLEGNWRYFPTPTRNAVNSGDTVAGFVSDTRFSLDRGFYTTPQSLVISTDTPGAAIYVTTDGSEPHPENASATPYSGPISIASTTVVRAAAFRDDWQETDVDTQTYLFAGQVSDQPDSPQDFPTRWVPNLSGSRAPVPAFSHYGMNDRILATLPLTDAGGRDFELEDALTAIPSMSLVIGPDLLFDPVTGLHRNAQSRGRTWERPASLEIIDPNTGISTQVNCGLRMHGGWNRFPEMLKKAFRIYLRSEYGDPNLEYPLFPNSDLVKFDRLILRSGNGKAWPSPWRALAGGGNSLERVTYLRDQIVREFQQETGNEAIPGTFVHLYINGLYWGLYNPVERPSEHFAAARFGGEDEDYDVIKWARGSGHQIAAGSDDGWNELISKVRGNVNNEQIYQRIGELLELTSFVDYIIVNHFAGNTDWIDNNVYAMRNREADHPFRFFCWDSEESFLSVGTDISDSNVSDTCAEIHFRLRSNPEYRLLFADRAQKHFFDDGALTAGRTRKILSRNAALIDQAVVGESVRWGSLLRPANPYDRADWLREVNNLNSRYLGQRVALTLNQMRADNLFPSVSAPNFSSADGSIVDEGTLILLTGSLGKIYYTLDGSDPRLAGGQIAPQAIEFDEGIPVTEETLIRARVLNGTTWSPIKKARFFLGDRAHDLIISEIMYHPVDGGAEYLEVLNQGSVSHQLRDLRLSGGIQFDFANVNPTSLAPGQRMVLVRRSTEFALAYPAIGFAGDYEGALGNGGDRFSLIDGDGETLWTLEYGDDSPWPVGTDGQGFSLVYVDGEPSSSDSWRSSIEPGGNPGESDSKPLTPGQNLLEYAIKDLGVIHSEGPGVSFYVAFKDGADEAEVIPQWSADLVTWHESDFVLKSQKIGSEGDFEKTWHILHSTQSARLFLRAYVEAR